MTATTSFAAPFPGFNSPNYTPVPDELFDALLPTLSGPELRTLLYIIRRTFGFKKHSDSISLSQMLAGITKADGTKLDHGTGLSKPALLKALRSLCSRQIITASRRRSPRRGNLPTTYALYLRYDRSDALAKAPKCPPATESKPVPLVNRVHQAGSKAVAQGLVSADNPTTNRSQETEYVNDATLDLHKEGVEIERRVQLVEDILQVVGDRKSERFYQQLARRLPENVLRAALSETRYQAAQGRIRKSPGAFSTHTLRQLAEEHNLPVPSSRHAKQGARRPSSPSAPEEPSAFHPQAHSPQG